MTEPTESEIVGDQGLLGSEAMIASGQKGLAVRNARNDDSKDNNKDSYFGITMLHFLWSFKISCFSPFSVGLALVLKEEVSLRPLSPR